MSWNKDLPSGQKAANLLDDDQQTNNYALETAVDAEHRFTTGGNQSGRHHFMVDSTENIEAVSDFVAGSFAFANNISGYTDIVPYFCDGTSWYYGLTEETLTIPNDWTAGQYCTPNALTPGATVASDWDDAEFFTLTLADDPTELSNPSNLHFGKRAVRYYIIQQSTPASELTFGTYFNGAPVISDVAGSVNVLQCVQEGNADIRASFLPTAATATVQGLVELATDAEAATGTDATKALTPDNLGQNYDSTWNSGHFEIIGTQGLLVQFKRVSISSSPQTITWDEAFSTANYTVIATYDSSSQINDAITCERVSGTQFKFRGQTGHACQFLGIGIKA